MLLPKFLTQCSDKHYLPYKLRGGSIAVTPKFVYKGEFFNPMLDINFNMPLATSILCNVLDIDIPSFVDPHSSPKIISSEDSECFVNDSTITDSNTLFMLKY